jgi:hypothetical protein
MVVNLIMRSCRPRSFANQRGPRRSEASGQADLFGAGHPSAGVSMLRVVVATRLPPGSCPLCRPGDRRCVGQVTDVCGAVRHADRSRSIPVGHPGRRMIEHDCNPASRQAVYPVGEEHGPDPPAPQQGAGRDLTRQPYPGATATPAASTEAPQPGRASPGKARSRRVGASGAGGESAA